MFVLIENVTTNVNNWNDSLHHLSTIDRFGISLGFHELMAFISDIPRLDFPIDAYAGNGHAGEACHKEYKKE